MLSAPDNIEMWNILNVSLNYLQRCITVAAIFFLLTIVLFPPRVERTAGEFGSYLKHSRGRSFVFSNPEPSTINKEVSVDWTIVLLNVATVVTAWIAVSVILRGKFDSTVEQISTVRLPLALVIGGIAPVPPFVVAHTYLPILFFLFSAFADTGHVPSSSILGFGLLFWCIYSAVAFGMLWLLVKIKTTER